ncbi:MAG: flagellar biosynthesis protein FlhB [Gudongella sp.]|nr:flagellar biosynthesis protein FlhB [Gudongella sp.]
MSDKHSKTEEPSPKKLRDAKKKGQVAKSNELSPAISLMVFAMAAVFMGQLLINNATGFLRKSLTLNFGMEINSGNARRVMGERIMDLFVMLLPYLVIAVVLGIIVNVAQTGFIFTTHPIKPDIKRINPIEGFKNIFSKKSIFTLVKNLAKLILVFYLTYNTLSKSVSQILNAGSIGTEKLFFFLILFVKDLVFNIGIIMLGLAVIDYVFQRREFRNNLKMTKQEVKDEYKEMEGNPQIKQARQQKQREIAMSRMMSAIPQADVIVTNPTHLAIAIRYDQKKDNAPIVLAKGADFLATKIREMAKENKIPIMENKELARAIYKKTEIGDYVPIELYKAVAEILALVYQLKEKNKRKI